MAALAEEVYPADPGLTVEKFIGRYGANTASNRARGSRNPNKMGE
jgi:hypothetical protein